MKKKSQQRGGGMRTKYNDSYLKTNGGLVKHALCKCFCISLHSSCHLKRREGELAGQCQLTETRVMMMNRYQWRHVSGLLTGLGYYGRAPWSYSWLNNINYGIVSYILGVFQR